MIVGTRIESRLSALVMSQTELARRVGVSQATIAHLITGRSRSSSHLHKIAQELRTSPEYLSGETDNPDPAFTPALVLSADDREMLKLFQAMAERDKSAILQIVRTMSGQFASEVREE